MNILNYLKKGNIDIQKVLFFPSPFCSLWRILGQSLQSPFPSIGLKKCARNHWRLYYSWATTVTLSSSMDLPPSGSLELMYKAVSPLPRNSDAVLIITLYIIKISLKNELGSPESWSPHQQVHPLQGIKPTCYSWNVQIRSTLIFQPGEHL
jgi:hypothetical protein